MEYCRLLLTEEKALILKGRAPPSTGHTAGPRFPPCCAAPAPGAQPPSGLLQSHVSSDLFCHNSHLHPPLTSPPSLGGRGGEGRLAHRKRDDWGGATSFHFQVGGQGVARGCGSCQSVDPRLRLLRTRRGKGRGSEEEKHERCFYGHLCLLENIITAFYR